MRRRESESRLCESRYCFRRGNQLSLQSSDESPWYRRDLVELSVDEHPLAVDIDRLRAIAEATIVIEATILNDQGQVINALARRQAVLVVRPSVWWMTPARPA